MKGTRMFLYVALGLAAVAVVVIALFLQDDGKATALKAAPGQAVVLPFGTLLERYDNVTSTGGAGAYLQSVWGTDASAEQILTFYDAELGKLGYQPTALPPPPPPSAEAQSVCIRRYTQGPFTYQLNLGQLPWKVGSRWLKTGYQHVLVARLSN